MFADIIWLIAGLVLILAGANYLTDGASAIALRMGVSDLIVGLTVVAFGTSAPELIISVLSAARGSSELAVGNVVGSNIFNICIIIGVVAMVKPISVTRGIMNNEIPLVILSSAALLAIGCGPLLGDNGPAICTRTDAILLLLFFCVFMRYTFASAKNGAPQPESDDSNTPEKSIGTLRAIIYVIGGLAALVWGGDRFVAGASSLAYAMGVSEAVVGLTIVALGTSLPELATSITAAVKGRGGIALGNVIGSNIFNVFMVLGAAGTIHPCAFGQIGPVDLTVLMAASLLFYLFGWKFGDRVINRYEGAVFVLLYIGYITYLILQI